MTKVTISKGTLLVEMLGWDKFWAFKSRVEIPMSRVSGARMAAGERVRGLRIPGTYVPGLITAGTYRHDGQRDFWAVHDFRQAVLIELHEEYFARLVVQVPDPAATIAAVQDNMTPHGA